jgi:hypothetical protein
MLFVRRRLSVRRRLDTKRDVLGRFLKLDDFLSSCCSSALLRSIVIGGGPARCSSNRTLLGIVLERSCGLV